MGNIITRNIKGKIIALAAALIIFIGLHALSVTAFKDVYLFEWLARARYCYVWAASVLLILFDQTLVSYCVTLGALCGAFIGQYLGDFLRERNMAKLTPDMSNEIKYRLSLHHGAFIFAITVLGFAAAGIVCKVSVSAYRKRKKQP